MAHDLLDAAPQAVEFTHRGTEVLHPHRQGFGRAVPRMQRDHVLDTWRHWNSWCATAMLEIRFESTPAPLRVQPGCRAGAPVAPPLLGDCHILDDATWSPCCRR